MYLIIRGKYRLCQDDRWRGHVPFGSDGGCLKEYARQANAKKKAQKVRGAVVEVPAGVELDAAGGGQFPEGDKFVLENHVIADFRPDFTVESHGSIVRFSPTSTAGREKIPELGLESWQLWADGFVLDHHVAANFIEQLSEEGFTFTREPY